MDKTKNAEALISQLTEGNPELQAAFDALGFKKKRKEITTKVQTSDKEEVRQIILPKGMDKLTASKELEKQWENEETETTHHADFEGWNYQDTLVAIKNVTEKEFGWMNSQKGGFFGMTPPMEIDIVIDMKDGKAQTTRAFYGNFAVTFWDNAQCQVNISKSGIISCNITAKKKFATDISAYFNLVREYLYTNSIYRGRNISVTGTKDKLDFTIIENKGSEKIILNRDENISIEQFVISSLGEPGKRTYLFTGGYGTGKTETAMKIGRIGVEKHNLSFFYVKDSSLFETVLSMSKNYQPCLIFLEDVDEITGGDERNARINGILNTLDGVETKGNNITTLFTTNHEKRINKALRRPGRIDLMVRFENPNDETKAKIMKTYFGHLPGGADLEYEALAAKMPKDIQGAVVAEICKRAVKLFENKDKRKKDGEIVEITNDMVEAAGVSMKFQIELMAEEVEAVSSEVQFVGMLKEVFKDSMTEYGV